MPYMGGLVLLVMIVALVDIVSSDEALVRGLPRWGWLLLVIVLPLVGSIVWFVAGRPVASFSGRLPRDIPGAASKMGYPEYDHPGRYVPSDPEADAAFLAQVRARADAQRAQGEAERRRRDNDL